jgi:hypothetical protein
LSELKAWKQPCFFCFFKHILCSFSRLWLVKLSYRIVLGSLSWDLKLPEAPTVKFQRGLLFQQFTSERWTVLNTKMSRISERGSHNLSLDTKPRWELHHFRFHGSSLCQESFIDQILKEFTWQWKSFLQKKKSNHQRREARTLAKMPKSTGSFDILISWTIFRWFPSDKIISLL